MTRSLPRAGGVKPAHAAYTTVLHQGEGTVADKAAMALAKSSYERCCEVPDFFQTFYRNFLAACPAARPLFARTDFGRQDKLLRHAVGLLLIFPNQPPGEPSLLARLAERHSRRDLNIDPGLYRPFIDSLIDTVRQVDRECTPAVEQAWRTTVALGVEYMKARY
ncbi:MAG TPA: globin [Gemmatimonadales bacterium]|nr:globin [Gemmatimonadales bacterium]